MLQKSRDNMNVKSAFKFIESYGNNLERYRAKYLFEGIRDSEVPLNYLRKLQNKDGGFPYNLEMGKPSSVNETSGILDIVAELDLLESDVCQKIMKYLFQIQSPNGSWNENPEINQFNPPQWDRPDNINTRMWLTSDLIVYLVHLGYAESQHVKHGLEFLQKQMDEKGKVEGPQIATWIATAIFGKLEGSKSLYVRKALDLLEDWLDEEREDAAFLCWYLECLMYAGVPKEHALVQRCLSKLKTLQDKDGGWKSADAAKYNVSTTINALKLLKHYGKL
jgi:prenyltransferase beta subunit